MGINQDELCSRFFWKYGDILNEIDHISRRCGNNGKAKIRDLIAHIHRSIYSFDGICCEVTCCSALPSKRATPFEHEVFNLQTIPGSSDDAGGSFPTLEEVKKAGFEDSIAIGTLVSERLEDKKDDKTTKEVLQALLQKEAGARGFFVSFLTSENEDGSRTLADSNPPVPLISDALKEADNKVVGPLLVMNTVMPTAMVLAHRRNGNEDFAEMSQRVATRAQILLKDNPESLSLVKAAREAAAIKADGEAPVSGEKQDPGMPAYWIKFYEKYEYDSDMCGAISAALSNVISAVLKDIG
eukprot:jgi/Bigna1/131339/aug1.14_g6047